MSVIKNNAWFGFYNIDVNCNAINNDNTYVVGLNEKTLPLSLDYSYIVGDCQNCSILGLGYAGDGDGIVSTVNANLSNFRTLPSPRNEFIYEADALNPAIGLHSDLPTAVPVNMKAFRWT